MAAPHISGAAALLMQAKPALRADQIEQVLTSTTTAGNPGRLDAYRALLSVTESGGITGAVRRARDYAFLEGAIVTFQQQDNAPFGGRVSRTRTDRHAGYYADLAPGRYKVEVSFFGYAPTSAPDVEVKARELTQQDFYLESLPTGTITGQVADRFSGQPLSARVSASGLLTTTTFNGLYTLYLPAGRYELCVSSAGHRISRVETEVRVGETITQDIALDRAPTILLVDSGAWYYNSQATYYQQALDQLGYLYDVRTVYEALPDRPTAETLAAYDIVIWSCPEDSPGLIGADEALAEYLESGGKLLLSGQDIAFWDGGGAFFTYAPYFTTPSEGSLCARRRRELRPRRRDGGHFRRIEPADQWPG